MPLATAHRMWALQRLRQLMVSRHGRALNIPSLLKTAEPDSALSSLLQGLPQSLLRQYQYEEPIVRGGKHLMHSAFFQVYY